MATTICTFQWGNEQLESQNNPTGHPTPLPLSHRVALIDELGFRTRHLRDGGGETIPRTNGAHKIAAVTDELRGHNRGYGSCRPGFFLTLISPTHNKLVIQTGSIPWSSKRVLPWELMSPTTLTVMDCIHRIHKEAASGCCLDGTGPQTIPCWLYVDSFTFSS